MTIEETITGYEERLRLAQLGSDVEELNRLLADALIFSAWDGCVVGKSDDLNLHRSPEFQITRMEVIDRNIVCFDGVAIVNVVMDTSAEFGGNAEDKKIRYVRVWHQFPDGWRIISGFMKMEQDGVEANESHQH